jgi:predicted GIY-YIG superfamily endonuclease
MNLNEEIYRIKKMMGLITEIKWTEDAIRDIALTYSSKTEFKNKSPRAWEVARSKGNEFYDSVTSHMIKPIKNSEEYLRDVAKKYNVKQEFKDKDSAAHTAARKLGKEFFDGITSHMIDGRTQQEVKWTDEILKDLTSKYDKLSSFTKENPQAYEALRRRGREKFDELTSHMDRLRPDFTEDELRNIALKYNNSSEFTKNDASAQQSARSRGKEFYDDITKHFVKLQRDPYTFDEVMNIASKYDTVAEFQKKESSVYQVARNHGWIEEVIKHMSYKRNLNWTLEEIREIAKQYPTKKEFRDGNLKAYNWALTNLTPEEYDEITLHMEPLGNIANRMIYAFEFPDNSVYVGLTFNSKKRFEQHMKSIKSAVNKYMVETGLTPVFKKVTEYLSKEEAVKMEGQIEKQYKNNGWRVLNVAKTGALGSSILKWTFDEVQKEALKYDRLIDFQKKSSGAYGSALRNGWVDDITKHMVKKKNKYTYGEVKNVALLYHTLKDFREKNNGAYQAAKLNGWFDDVTSHMIKGPKKGSKWDDYDKVRQEALKYQNTTDFKKYSSGAFKSAYRNGWFQDVTKHMKRYVRK